MKNILLCFISFISISIFSQNTKELDWDYSNFLKYKKKKASAYGIPLRKNGKEKRRDSILLFSKEIDLKNNTVYGIDSYLIYSSHAPAVWNPSKFKSYYNSEGLLLKGTSSPIEIHKKKKYGYIEYEIEEGESIHTYDDQNNKIRSEYRIINNQFSIDKSSKDTTHIKSIQDPKIYETIYNSNNQKIKQYITIDSTRYIKTKSYNPENRNYCYYCKPKYLFIKWKYDQKNRLIERISYTDENELHTKNYYFYDKENRLKKQIDSTGWYIYEKPLWKSTTTFTYDSDKTIKTTLNNTDSNGSYFQKIITVYDKNNNILNEKSLNDSPEKESWEIINTWNKGNLIESKTIKSNGIIYTTRYKYNNQNLIIEKSKFTNKRRTRLTRYYYEKME
ncbi:hypothetical protein [Aureivirga sp. CE67]|uniref:hypothetical protein n=1 Tax=Aureivirga sp. CE67 TaxID=1788983 RepID=UPI0018CBC9FC|nr:hypothetical protein [Aureivirga sp. CE67]